MSSDIPVEAKCQNCSEETDAFFLDYHSNGYCLNYSYEEYLNLKNGYPAKPYIQEYIPEIWQVEKDLIYALKLAAKNGLEYAEECLTEHDARLGRTIRRNREWAENIESDIKQMKQTLETLAKYESSNIS